LASTRADRACAAEVALNMQDMEGYKELMDKMLDTLPAEQVLSH
jgi:hypothetical protein